MNSMGKGHNLKDKDFERGMIVDAKRVGEIYASMSVECKLV